MLDGCNFWVSLTAVGSFSIRLQPGYRDSKFTGHILLLASKTDTFVSETCGNTGIIIGS